MQAKVPLEKMTVAEKLQVLEDIWEDLRRNAEDVPAPAWHGDVLRAREQQVAEGKSRFISMAKAKRTIRERTR